MNGRKRQRVLKLDTTDSIFGKHQSLHQTIINGQILWNCGVAHLSGHNKQQVKVMEGHNHSTQWEAENCISLYQLYYDVTQSIVDRQETTADLPTCEKMISMIRNLLVVCYGDVEGYEDFCNEIDMGLIDEAIELVRKHESPHAP